MSRPHRERERHASRGCRFCDDGGAELQTAYRDLVINTLRKRGPETHVFMGIVSAGNREGVMNVAQRIIAERTAVGDDKMYAFLAKPFTWEEVTARNGHGTPAWTSGSPPRSPPRSGRRSDGNDLH